MMKKSEEKIGVFVEARCCTECDWFQNPIPIVSRTVCPECGAFTETVIGRYRYVEYRTWFRRWTDIKGFIKKS